MCLAIYKPENLSLPSKEIIEAAWQNNPHGVGLAIVPVGSDKVTIIKGFMTLDVFLNYLEDNKEFLESARVGLHFRYATSGNVDQGMTHPFPISSKNSELKALKIETDKALIHNGVLFSPSGNYSDTAIFSKFLALYRPDNDLINEFSEGSRLLIMTADKTEFFGQWHEIDGLYYSNKSIFYSYHDYDDYDDFSYIRKKDRPSLYDDPFYFSESEIAEGSLWDRFLFDSSLNSCPCCGSEEVELIGRRIMAVECLECGTIYNETDFLPSELILTEKKA